MTDDDSDKTQIAPIPSKETPAVDPDRTIIAGATPVMPPSVTGPPVTPEETTQPPVDADESTEDAAPVEEIEATIPPEVSLPPVDPDPVSIPPAEIAAAEETVEDEVVATLPPEPFVADTDAPVPVDLVMAQSTDDAPRTQETPEPVSLPPEAASVIVEAVEDAAPATIPPEDIVTEDIAPESDEPDEVTTDDAAPMILHSPEPAAPAPSDPASSPPLAAPMPEAPAPIVADGSAVPIGTIINNNYAITQLISAGGMGEVFRGENTFTGDAVAIKIVLQSLAHDEKIANLFKREAKVLCGLSDQSIVRYYNFVRDADLDRFCLIMEFIDGIALSDHVTEVAPLGREEGQRLLRRLAGGLARAHAMDVVHRDLSPDNVMLRGGNIDEAVLIDFGIAKSSEMAESTLHGQLAGKFKYISPEQLGHFGGEIGPRTDIYGLGLLMAAALRGEPIDMGSSVVEAVDARRGIPDVSDIDGALRPLIAHMLEPNPADRPASMTDVIRLLNDPTTIPDKYGQVEGVIPAGQEQFQSYTTNTGLQSPPGSVPPTTGFGQPSIVPAAMGEHSQSPFGGAPQTSQLGGIISQPGQTMNQTTAAKKASGGGVAGAVRWLILLGMLGAGGFYLSQNPELIFPPEEVAGEEPLEDPAANTPSGPMTRSMFLASYVTDSCGFAERIVAGPKAGTIATYSEDPTVFDGMMDEYETLFDSAPATENYTIDAVQCPVVDLAQVLAAQTGAAPVLTLDSDDMTSGGSIVGRLSDRRGRPVWLALVTTQGGVYNLTDRLTEQADGSATFSFALNAPDGSEAQPQVLVAIASDGPLIAAAASTSGASAASVMPLIEAEVLGRDGEAGMTLGYFDLRP